MKSQLSVSFEVVECLCGRRVWPPNFPKLRHLCFVVVRLDLIFLNIIGAVKNNTILKIFQEV
jgi:hypothetical protein